MTLYCHRLQSLGNIYINKSHKKRGQGQKYLIGEEAWSWTGLGVRVANKDLHLHLHL